MARAAKLDLRTFQQELAARLATKTAAQVESSRLGFSCGDERWLIRLSDAGEVITMPVVVQVPATGSKISLEVGVSPPPTRTLPSVSRIADCG